MPRPNRHSLTHHPFGKADYTVSDATALRLELALRVSAFTRRPHRNDRLQSFGLYAGGLDRARPFVDIRLDPRLKFFRRVADRVGALREQRVGHRLRLHELEDFSV